MTFACLIGQNTNQYMRDSSHVIQQQTGNLVLDSSDSQFSRADIDRQKDLNKLSSITEERRVVQEVRQKDDKTYHTNRRPVGLVTESYETLVEQDFQQIGSGTAEDSSIFLEKRERGAMHITHGSDNNDMWKQKGYRMCHDY